ncbi:hypothetical protein HYX14_05500 [Candidatus Woesearchaeota archaeon]|nr:hypothetical protein [Candidatus Woesearchaeota archaeon]
MALKVSEVKEIIPCQSLCLNGTSCLNRAKYGDYCWRHQNGFRSEGEMVINSTHQYKYGGKEK